MTIKMDVYSQELCSVCGRLRGEEKEVFRGEGSESRHGREGLGSKRRILAEV